MVDNQELHKRGDQDNVFRMGNVRNKRGRKNNILINNRYRKKNKKNDRYTYIIKKNLIEKKKERPVLCKNLYSFDIQRSMVIRKKSIVRSE